MQHRPRLAITQSVLILCLAILACSQVTPTPNDFPTRPATALPATPRPLPTLTLVDDIFVLGFDSGGTLYIGGCGFGPHLMKISPAGLPTAYNDLPCIYGLAFDHDDNLYLAYGFNNRVGRMDQQDRITTVAGSGPAGFAGDGGPATAAQLSQPMGVAVDAAGNLYISDQGNNRIRKVDRRGIITTVAGTGTNSFSGDGGPATAATLDGPYGLVFDAHLNLYIADSNNTRIRKVNPQGIITTVAGNGGPEVAGDGGPATAAALSRPIALAFDAAGSLYFSEAGGRFVHDDRVRKIDTQGIITTVAGTGPVGITGDGGPATAALVSGVVGLALDSQGNVFLTGNSGMRRVDKQGIIDTVIWNRP